GVGADLGEGGQAEQGEHNRESPHAKASWICIVSPNVAPGFQARRAPISATGTPGLEARRYYLFSNMPMYTPFAITLPSIAFSRSAREVDAGRPSFAFNP